MTQSILLVLAIAAIWYVIAWSIRNDKARSIGDETGLIRLRRVRDGKDEDKPAVKERTPAADRRLRGRTSRRR
ncbi:MAG: hypothetical protein ACE5ED_05990 [Rhodothalassiaceae bacterium]